MISTLIEKRFFTWDIHYACNYLCEHCYFKDEWKELHKKNKYPGIEKWIEVWKDIYERYGECYIHISGGEPFAYPGIIDLVSEMVKWHRIGFDTNLSFDADELIEKVGSPDRLSFSAAFHPGFVDFEVFLKKYDRLRSAGCKAKGLNFVAYPPVIKDIERYRKQAAEYGFDLTVLPYRGGYQSKEYPRDYSDMEREMIWGPKTEPDIPPEHEQKEHREAPESDSIDNTPDPTKEMLEWYSDENSREGLKCYMGVVYAKVHPDGTAHRCCMTWENWGCIGNMLDGTFKFSDEPQSCPYAKCACSSAMIAGEEKRWEGHWKNRVK